MNINTFTNINPYDLLFYSIPILVGGIFIAHKIIQNQRKQIEENTRQIEQMKNVLKQLNTRIEKIEDSAKPTTLSTEGLESLKEDIEYVREYTIGQCIPSGSELYLYNALMTLQEKELSKFDYMEEILLCNMPYYKDTKSEHVYGVIRKLYRSFRQARHEQPDLETFTEYLLSHDNIPCHIKPYIKTHRDSIDNQFFDYQKTICLYF